MTRAELPDTATLERAAPHASLKADEVHVWAIRAYDPPVAASDIHALLSDDERDRALRFRQEADRTRFSVGRAVSRVLLAAYADADPSLIRIERDRFGRPHPAGDGPAAALDLSVAHSGAWCLVGFTRGRAVGVDVERIRPVRWLERITAERFTSREAARLRALPGARRPPAFFACWTRKEACLKAAGRGLAMPLGRFEVSEAPDGPARVLSVDGAEAEGARWSLWSLRPRGGYLAAVAAESPGLHLVARVWSGTGGVEEWRS